MGRDSGVVAIRGGGGRGAVHTGGMKDAEFILVAMTCRKGRYCRYV
jgi:hypothetical protein